MNIRTRNYTLRINAKSVTLSCHRTGGKRTLSGFEDHSKTTGFFKHHGAFVKADGSFGDFEVFCERAFKATPSK